MAISVRCPHCKQVSQANDPPGGGGELQLRCPGCRATFLIRVPVLDAPEVVSEEHVPQAKAPPVTSGGSDRAVALQVKALAPAAPWKAPTRPELDDVEVVRPRSRRPRGGYDDVAKPRASGNLGLILGLSIGGGVLALAVVVAVVVMIARSAAEAEQAAQAQLAAQIQMDLQNQLAAQNQPMFPNPPVIQNQPQAKNQPGVGKKRPRPGFNAGNPGEPNAELLDPTRADHFDKMLAELKSDAEDRRLAAYRWLKEADPNHERRGEAAKILEERVPQYRALGLNGGEPFFAAYFAWATTDNFPWLSNMARNEEFSVWGNQRRHTAMQVLARLKDERGVEPIAENLGSIHHRDVAYQALVSMGALAEKKLIPMLVNGSREIRPQVARVLGAIGTRESLGPLEKAAQLHTGFLEGNFHQEINNARAAIQGREK